MYSFVREIGLIKVLNVMHHSKSGGPFKRITNVGRKIRERGIQTVIVMPNNDGPSAAFPAVKEGFTVYQIPHRFPIDVKNPLVHIKWFLALFPSILFLTKIIRREGVNIVHNNGMLNIQASIAAIITGKKLVWHLNDIDTPKIIIKLLSPFAKIFADSLPVAAENVRTHYFGNWREKCPILYAPVDTRELDPKNVYTRQTSELKKEMHIESNMRIVGTVGHISPAKGYEYFILATAKIVKREPNVKFVIVGPELETRKDYFKKLKRCEKLQTIFQMLRRY